jgi:hypothetical protein
MTLSNRLQLFRPGLDRLSRQRTVDHEGNAIQGIDDGRNILLSRVKILRACRVSPKNSCDALSRIILDRNANFYHQNKLFIRFTIESGCSKPIDKK